MKLGLAYLEALKVVHGLDSLICEVPVYLAMSYPYGMMIANSAIAWVAAAERESWMDM